MRLYALSFFGETAADLLQSALDLWNWFYDKILSFLTVPVNEMFGGEVWNIVTDIITVIEGTGITLLILCYLYGFVRSSISYQDIRRHPKELVFSLFRLLLAKFAVTYASSILLWIMRVAQDLIGAINSNVTAVDFAVPDNLRQMLEETDWANGLGAWVTAAFLHLFIALLAVVLVVMVYARYFKIFLMSAIAPIPLAGFASEHTELMGRNYLKSYIAECLRGVLILIACMIFSAIASSPTAELFDMASWTTLYYGANILFQLLLLIITIRASDRMVKEIFGL